MNPFEVQFKLPDSIFDKSRTSLINVSRLCPEEWIVLANSICFSLRLPSIFSASIWDKISMLFSGFAAHATCWQKLGFITRGKQNLFFTCSKNFIFLSSDFSSECSSLLQLHLLFSVKICDSLSNCSICMCPVTLLIVMPNSSDSSSRSCTMCSSKRMEGSKLNDSYNMAFIATGTMAI